MFRYFSALVVTCLLLLVGTLRCAPEAKFARCGHDSDCPDSDVGTAYCVRNHCVECVTSASCGAHRRCREGQCVAASS